MQPKHTRNPSEIPSDTTAVEFGIQQAVPGATSWAEVPWILPGSSPWVITFEIMARFLGKTMNINRLIMGFNGVLW